MIKERWTQRSADDYAAGFNNLLPTGPAWPRGADDPLQMVVRGLTEIWGVPVESSAALLLTLESDPRKAVGLLPEWERAWGLPDACLDEVLEIVDRQIALVTKMTLIGAQDRAFFIAIALAIGYVITITEYSPYMCGESRCGDTTAQNPDDPTRMRWELGPSEIRFYWTVYVANARLTWFRTTSGQVGIDPHLRIGLASDLECLLRRYKPAHTEILFDYSGLATGGSMAGTP